MYNITLKELGQRLKQVREYLGFSQKELADKVDCKQNAISNIELGKGGSITLLLNLFNFYSSYIYIDLIFTETFYLVSNNDKEEAKKSSGINSIIAELINQAQQNYEREIKNATQTANAELKENLQKAINLLNS